MSEESVPSVIERTIFVEGLRISVEKLAQKIKPLFSEKYGENAVQSLVRRKDGYEITFENATASQECVQNGLVIDDRQYDVVSSANMDIVVTFTPVAAYIEDSVLTDKLKELGCQVMSEMKRTQVHGIETGRRKITVRLPNNLRSLQKAILVKAPNGRDERIEVFHRNQKNRRITR